MNALYTTLIIALLSALIATILGTAAAIGIQAMRKKMRTVVTGVTNIPIKCRYCDRNLSYAVIHRM